MNFVNKFKKTLIDIELNIFDDDKIYKELCELYEDKTENNNLLITTIEDYNFQPQKWLIRHFINVLLKYLLDNNLLWDGISNKIRWLLYQKINDILWNPEIRWEYLEFHLFFRLSPGLNEVIELEKKFNLKYYLYRYFLDYYFINKKFQNFEESLNIYLDKYFIIDSSDFRPFILQECSYESWFEKKSICDLFIKYFNDNFDKLIQLVVWYKIDGTILELLCKNWSNDLVQSFLKLLINRCLKEHDYEFEHRINSEVIENLVRYENTDTDFCKYIFDKFLSWEFWIFRLWIYVLKWIITESNLSDFFRYKRENYIIIQLYYNYDDENTIKKQIYKKYKKIIDDSIRTNKENNALEREIQQKEKNEIKNKINSLIKNSLSNKKSPCREIIYLYNNYPKAFTKEQIEFVKNEIIFYFSSNEFNLRNSEVQVIQQNSNSFTIPRFLKDLLLCVNISVKLWMDISKYINIRKWLIPYVFDSELELILNDLLKIWIDKLSKDDVDWLIDIYLNNRHWDLHKFHNIRIPTLISKWFVNINDLSSHQKNSIYKVYINKLNDTEDVANWEKIVFLESILEIWDFNKKWLYQEYSNYFAKFNNYSYYEDYLLNNIDENLIDGYERFLKLNEIMITLYKNKDCIKWRLKQLNLIRTDYIRENWNWSWIWRGFSKRDEEIFRSNSKSKRFYMCLIDVIKYPNYVDDIKKILSIVKKFYFNEESYIKRYIYDFCFEYFKKVSEKKQYEVALLINDEDFVKKYLFNVFSEAIKEKFRTHELEKFCLNINKKNNSNKNLGKKFWELLKKYEKSEKKVGELSMKLDELNRCSLINKNSDNIKIVLYVEWKYDKIYIEKAFYVLSQLFPNNFKWLNLSVVNCAWANNIPMLINSYINDWIQWIHIWIFDIDSWWISAWENPNIENYWLERRLWKCDMKWNIFENKYKRNNGYLYSLILLPYTEYFKDQIFADNQENTFEKDDDPRNYLKNKNVILNSVSSPMFTIEHLLYWEGTNEFFDYELSFWNKKVLKVKNKKAKSKLFEYVDKCVISNNIRMNFLPLFQYIKTLYDEFKNNSSKKTWV